MRHSDKGTAGYQRNNHDCRSRLLVVELLPASAFRAAVNPDSHWMYNAPSCLVGDDLGAAFRVVAPHPISLAHLGPHSGSFFRSTVLAQYSMGRKSSDERAITLQPSKDRHHFLDLSQDHLIRAPPLTPPPRYESKPRDYWKFFNSAQKHYRRGWYDHAKAELLKLEEIAEVHKTAKTLLLRTYRKLISKELAGRKKATKKAISLYDEMFVKCDDVTDTDRRKYNKLLTEVSNGSTSQRKELQGKQHVAEFEVVEGPIHSANLLSQRLPIGKSVVGRGKWRFVSLVNGHELYTKPKDFDEEKNHYSRTIMIRLDSDGNSEETWEIGTEAWQLATAKNSDIVAIATGDLKLILFTSTGQRLATKDLSKIALRKYEIRAVAISDDGDRVVITCADKAIILDQKLNVIMSWGATAGPHRFSNKDLALLGLKTMPPAKGLKRAFRKKILEWHPDKNPDDQQAHQKTLEILDAFNRLSEGGAAEALGEIPGGNRYREVIAKIETGFGGSVSIAVGDGRDWIYAATLSRNNQYVYLATYSGKIYCVSLTGSVVKTLVFARRDAIEALRESQNHLVILLHGNLCVFDGKQIHHAATIPTGTLTSWGDEKMVLWEGKTLHVYSGLGKSEGKLAFKNSITSALWNKGRLVVTTSKARYELTLTT